MLGGEAVTGRLQRLCVPAAIVLIVSVFSSLSSISVVLASPIPYPCPANSGQLQTDITSVGNGGTVQLACSGPATVTFTSTITISQDVTLDGAHSSAAITFNGGNNTELFLVNSGKSLAINSLTLVDGSAAEGGAIFNNGAVTVSGSTFSGNSASDGGGAIVNVGTTTVSASVFTGNSATNGGAVLNHLGSLTVSSSSFSGNSAVDGGAIANSRTMTVSTSTFSRNSAVDGGAIANAPQAAATLSDSTFSGNSAPDGLGGAIYNGVTSMLTVSSSTLSGNSAPDGGDGGALYTDFDGIVTLGGDIIANSPVGGNCDNNRGMITDEGYNLDTDGSCTSGKTGDITGEDPLLGPLQNNGGPTPTMALLPGSPAIDQIPSPTGFAVNTTTYYLCQPNGADQRGYPRPDAGESVCDIGAYEYQVGSALSLPPGQTAYDIESSNWSCSGGGTSCIPTGTTTSACVAVSTTPTFCPGAVYSDVEAFGPPNNSSNGVPDDLILACIQGTNTGYIYGYLDVVSSQGAIDYPGGVYGRADTGAIGGKGTVIGDDGSEDNPSQPSSVSASAYDTSRGIRGSVTGIQNTDNGSDTLNSGSFRITLSGTLTRVDQSTFPATMTTYSGTISCTAGGMQGEALAQAGTDTDALAEGELESHVGDNTFLPGIMPPPAT